MHVVQGVECRILSWGPQGSWAFVVGGPDGVEFVVVVVAAEGFAVDEVCWLRDSGYVLGWFWWMTGSHCLHYSRGEILVQGVVSMMKFSYLRGFALGGRSAATRRFCSLRLYGILGNGAPSGRILLPGM